LASLPLRIVPTLVAAALLAGLGMAGLRRSLSPAAVPSNPLGLLVEAPAATSVVLEGRESTLQRRRDAEELLAQFVRGQMTRHYWGHFAGSLPELGLDAGEDLRARVEGGEGQTRLWLTPRRGDEGFLAEVRLKGDRLERMQCRGPLPMAEASESAGCPTGWKAFTTPDRSQEEN